MPNKPINLMFKNRDTARKIYQNRMWNCVTVQLKFTADNQVELDYSVRRENIEFYGISQ